MPLLLAGPAALVAGCGEEPRAVRASEAARDVALVEAAQERKPPVQPARPRPLADETVARFGLAGQGCAFTYSGEPAETPVAVFGRTLGIVNLADRTLVLAADSGSAALPAGAFERYAGRDHAVHLTHGGGSGEAAGAKARRWPGSLTIRDRYDRVVHFTAGVLRCAA